MRHVKARLVRLVVAAVAATAAVLACAMPATAATDAPSAAVVAAGCSVGALTDRVDPRPANIYGSGWINCTFVLQGAGVFVDLYRNGHIVASGHQACGLGTGCGASTPEYTDGTPGNQQWKTRVIVRSQAYSGEAWSPVYYH
ncbi:MAG: hypothetical protein GEV10_31940 [Streptosporangiales bacterium]|nr:hypothetical protein [Streptosporangiales bacterium]